MMECYGIIPARFESTRFPGKPLTEILGKPMFWHVYQRTMESGVISKATLATDDERIRRAADRYQIPVVMTRPDHHSGTDRVFEAATILKLPEDSIIVNIQGDEPALAPEMIRELLDPFRHKRVQVATLARKISPEEARSADVVTVVFRQDGEAMYFSRSTIPYFRGESEGGCYAHVGMYAFRLPVLRAFVSMSPSALEKAEKLEQLRLLENGIPIHVAVTAHKSHGVDRPKDVDIVKAIIENDNGDH